MERKRIDWIDVAKGFAIITVIVGHSCGGVVRGFIYSFHMPLFFILSAMTFKYSKDINSFKDNVKRAFKHLIIPALASFTMLTIYHIIQNPSIASTVEFWRTKFYTLLYASGADAHFAGMHVPMIAMLWFLFALFLGRSIFDLIQLNFSPKATLLISLVLSLAGVAIGNVYWMPFSLDIALAILPLFYLGYYWQKHKLKDEKRDKKYYKSTALKLLVSLAIWLLTLYPTFPDQDQVTYLMFVTRTYTLYPLCYICGIAGTVAVVQISKLLLCAKDLMLPIKTVGKHSMCLYILHSLDEIWFDFWNGSMPYIRVFNRVAADILVFTVVICISRLILKACERRRKFQYLVN